MRCERREGVLEIVLEAPPCNEIGTEFLEHLEGAWGQVGDARAVLLRSALPAGFSAGADLRELQAQGATMSPDERVAGVRRFLLRVNALLDAIDASPVPVVAAVHGVCFGGGLELALACDVIVADRTARFAFPELRLGLVPGFGGVPRLRRDVGNAVARDLLLLGRSLNATRAHEVGLVGQVVAEGAALAAARAAAIQMAKFDAGTLAAAKRWIKPPADREGEIEIFLSLFARPVVQENLRRFVDNRGPMPYLP